MIAHRILGRFAVPVPRAVTALLSAAIVGCGPAAERAGVGTTFTNVRIVDGTGAPARMGAVRIMADTIVAVGDVLPTAGDSIIDGGGMVLAPGFIDTHSHHDEGLLASPDALAAVSQGITTIIAGQDGGQPLPLAPMLDSLTNAPTALNIAFYAGHGSIRAAVLGDSFRRVATKAETDSMSAILRREMEAGALGLSTGLEYDPAIYSDRAEVLALAKVAASFGGRYISHIRSEDRFFWDAIDEIITIGRETKMPVQISHLKLAMVPLWGKTDSLFTLLNAARASGVDISADVYPYTYWQSTLTVLFPARDFSNRAEANNILREIAKPEGLLIGDFAANPSYRGKTVAEIAVMRKEDPAATLMGLIAEAQAWEKAHPENRSLSESVVATSMTESDIGKLYAWPQTNVSSDGALDGAHPRGYGAFPRVFARYVREQKAITLEDAVHKMTGLAAAHVGVLRRGTIVPGAFADLVLFNADSITDHATPAAPHAVSTGVSGVWVNGRAVWRNGKTTGTHPGRVIRRDTGRAG
jgi:N-acyl-D-amino-acid deacylase